MLMVWCVTASGVSGGIWGGLATAECGANAKNVAPASSARESVANGLGIFKANAIIGRRNAAVLPRDANPALKIPSKNGVRRIFRFVGALDLRRVALFDQTPLDLHRR